MSIIGSGRRSLNKHLFTCLSPMCCSRYLFRRIPHASCGSFHNSTVPLFHYSRSVPWFRFRQFTCYFWIPRVYGGYPADEQWGKNMNCVMCQKWIGGELKKPNIHYVKVGERASQVVKHVLRS